MWDRGFTHKKIWIRRHVSSVFHLLERVWVIPQTVWSLGVLTVGEKQLMLRSLKRVAVTG